MTLTLASQQNSLPHQFQELHLPNQTKTHPFHLNYLPLHSRHLDQLPIEHIQIATLGKTLEIPTS